MFWQQFKSVFRDGEEWLCSKYYKLLWISVNDEQYGTLGGKRSLYFLVKMLFFFFWNKMVVQTSRSNLKFIAKFLWDYTFKPICLLSSYNIMHFHLNYWKSLTLQNINLSNFFSEVISHFLSLNCILGKCIVKRCALKMWSYSF